MLGGRVCGWLVPHVALNQRFDADPPKFSFEDTRPAAQIFRIFLVHFLIGGLVRMPHNLGFQGIFSKDFRILPFF